MRIKNPVLLDHQAHGSGGGGGGFAHSGMGEEDRAQALAIAEAHDQIPLFRIAVAQRLSLREFQRNLLSAISTGAPQNQNQVTSVPTGGGAGGDLGSRLWSDPAFKQFLAGKGQQRGANMHLQYSSRATLLTSTGVTNYDRPVQNVVMLDQQPMSVAALLPEIQVSGSTVRITQEVSYTQAATAVGEGLEKPEATFDLVETDFPVRKIAVIGRVSDEMFSDFPQVQNYVNARLVYMVQSKEDNALINGPGTGSEITGILSTSGIQTVSAGAYPTIFDAIAQAAGKVWSVGFQKADGVIISPSDWFNLRLSKDGFGRYLLGDPGESAAVMTARGVAVGMVWGMPVAVSTSIAQGTAIVGAFNTAFIARREGLRLETTNSDASDFAFNRICIRAETRLALVIPKPRAFCTVTAIPASP